MQRITDSGIQLLIFILAMSTALLPGVYAQSTTRYGDDTDVSVKVNGDVVQQAGEENGVIVLVHGTARIEGTVQVLVVVDGTADLIDASIGELTVVQGEARLQGRTQVSGDVRLINATMERGEQAEILGSVKEGVDTRLGPGVAIFGVLFGLGFMLAVLLAGVMLAILAPHAVRRTGMAITDEPARTIGAGLAFWILMPVVAVVAMMTVIGMPVGLGFFIFVMPLLSFFGYLIAGIRIGDLTMEKLKGAVEFERPVLAAVVGLSILLVLGWLPIIGVLVTPIAAFMGTGALFLAIWRVVTRHETWREEPVEV